MPRRSQHRTVVLRMIMLQRTCLRERYFTPTYVKHSFVHRSTHTSMMIFATTHYLLVNTSLLSNCLNPCNHLVFRYFTPLDYAYDFLTLHFIVFNNYELNTFIC